jgi:hypothetical protein
MRPNWIMKKTLLHFAVFIFKKRVVTVWPWDLRSCGVLAVGPNGLWHCSVVPKTNTSVYNHPSIPYARTVAPLVFFA